MNRRTIIIAEAGVNHNGDIQLAKQLVEAAASAGADYIKFQTFKAEKMVAASAQKATYQKSNTGNSSESQLEMLKKLELDQDAHNELIKHAAKNNIRFLSTAFDLDSIELLIQLDIDFFKIPSGEITNLPYLERIGKSGKPVVLSTGMSTMNDISDAVNVLLSSGLTKEELTILHCNSQYPTAMDDVNLNAMLTIGRQFGVKVGYSDHTLGIEVPIAAVAMGASCIEKHFTLDKSMEGPDHKASLNPSELQAMVSGIRNIERAMGSEKKVVSASEQENRELARKSIVATKTIKKGEKFTVKNLGVKRPANGLSPMLWYKILGKQAIRDYNIDDLIELNE
jgi:N,N'-diacetyllegionaminate synthase